MALPNWAHTFATFDTETTGVFVDRDRIVTATIALVEDNGNVIEQHDWLVDPQVSIPAAATRVHGITTEDARAGGVKPQVALKGIVERLSSMLESGFPLVVYNAPFDLSLLHHECLRYGIAPLELMPSVIDPIILDKQFDRYRRGKRNLSTVANHYRVELSDAHDAAADAVAAALIAHKIVRQYADRIPEKLEDLHAAQIEWARDQALSLAEYFERIQKPRAVDPRWPLWVEKTTA